MRLREFVEVSLERTGDGIYLLEEVQEAMKVAKALAKYGKVG